MNVNNVVLVGRLTKDVDVQPTNGGGSMATFTLAVNRNYKNANNEYDADFINCVAFNRSANYLAKYTSKGQVIAVTGKLQVNVKDNNMGGRTYFTNVICDTVSSMKQDNNINNNDYYNNSYQSINNNYQQQQAQQLNQQRQQNKSGYDFIDLPEIDDNDLPF